MFEIMHNSVVNDTESVCRHVLCQVVVVIARDIARGDPDQHTSQAPNFLFLRD